MAQRSIRPEPYGRLIFAVFAALAEFERRRDLRADIAVADEGDLTGLVVAAIAIRIFEAVSCVVGHLSGREREQP